MTEQEEVERIRGIAARYAEAIDALFNIKFNDEQKSCNASSEYTEAELAWTKLKTEGGLGAQTLIKLCDAWLAKHTETEAN